MPYVIIDTSNEDVDDGAATVIDVGKYADLDKTVSANQSMWGDNSWEIAEVSKTFAVKGGLVPPQEADTSRFFEGYDIHAGNNEGPYVD